MHRPILLTFIFKRGITYYQNLAKGPKGNMFTHVNLLVMDHEGYLVCIPSQVWLKGPALLYVWAEST